MEEIRNEEMNYEAENEVTFENEELTEEETSSNAGLIALCVGAGALVITGISLGIKKLKSKKAEDKPKKKKKKLMWVEVGEEPVEEVVAEEVNEKLPEEAE